jgi:hypothetical protein
MIRRRGMIIRGVRIEGGEFLIFEFRFWIGESRIYDLRFTIYAMWLEVVTVGWWTLLRVADPRPGMARGASG